jgi:hypothetical protein
VSSAVVFDHEPLSAIEEIGSADQAVVGVVNLSLGLWPR